MTPGQTSPAAECIAVGEFESVSDPDRHLLVRGDLYRRIMSLGAKIALDPSRATVAEHMELANLRAEFWGTDLSWMP
jgi:hypothetical protein